MKRFMDWMTENFAPRMNKLAKNPWISSIQEAILSAMPLILIGSFVTMFNIIGEYVSWFPDLSLISSFSFGLLSLCLAYQIPFILMEKKKHRKTAKQAGMAGISLFLLLIYPLAGDVAGWAAEDGSFTGTEGLSILLGRMGTEGMLAAILGGLFVGCIMNLFAKHTFFKEDSAMPDFIIVWFDTLIPMLIIILVGWIFTFQLEISLFALINQIFAPFIAVGQSFWGFVLFNFLAFAFLYSFGISTWVLYPVMAAIMLPAIGANSVAAPGSELYIHTNETLNLFLIGGGGTTLGLNVLMLFSKSKRLKVVGRSCIVPSIFNINEPVVFGAPIAFNPLLMIPMWIMGFIGPVITYAALSLGLVPIPTQVFNFWYLPGPIIGYMVTQSIAGVFLVLIIFALSCVVYYPFLKVYDNQEYVKEQEKIKENSSARA